MCETPNDSCEARETGEVRETGPEPEVRDSELKTPSEEPETLSAEAEQDRRIRALNDQLRQSFMGGQIVMTAGFVDLPSSIKARAIAAIRSYDAFDEGNDPYGYHDFGSVEIDGHSVWFKVDAYDRSLQYGSPDAADPKVTVRVMTLLMPSEY